MLGEGPANDRVAAATDEIDRMIRDVRTTLFSLPTEHGNPVPGLPAQPGGPAGRTRDLLDEVVSSILQAGVLLQAAPELPRDTAGLRIADALHRLDDVVRDIRDYNLAGPGQENHSGLAGGSGVNSRRLWETADRAARLGERVAQTARALQISAADSVTLLEQHAAIARLP